MKLLVVLTLPLLVVWGSAGTNVKQSMNLHVSNKHRSLSDIEMYTKIKKANLEKHGYLKEVTSALKSKPGSSVPEKIKTYYYYKVVPCDRVMEVEGELNKLLNGVLGSSVARKVNKKLKGKKLKSRKNCKVGVEVHFRGQQSRGQHVKRSGSGWGFSLSYS